MRRPAYGTGKTRSLCLAVGFYVKELGIKRGQLCNILSDIMGEKFEHNDTNVSQLSRWLAREEKHWICPSGDIIIALQGLKNQLKQEYDIRSSNN